MAADQGARFVYFSTDYVFDGRGGPYTEDDPPRPLSVYGQSKYEAEQVLAEALGELLLTVRTTWVYGPERQGKNFAYQLAKTLGEGRPWSARRIRCRTRATGPTSLRPCWHWPRQGRSGLVHVAGPDWVDRVQFARALAEAFGRDAALIVAKTTAELGQPAARPLLGGLRTPRLDAWLPGSMRPLDQCLVDFRARLAEPEGWVRPLRPA